MTGKHIPAKSERNDMPSRYVFFCTLSYSYSILRPLQREIRRRGDDVAWFLESTCEDMLRGDERRLHTIDDVMRYRPKAVITAGDYVYPSFPGVKVCVFHGYPINKRADKHDDHFKLRGWFDICCTQSPLSTESFQKLAEKKGFFRVYETGWCRVDDFFSDVLEEQGRENEERKVVLSVPKQPSLDTIVSQKPTVIYACTYTKGITSAPMLAPVIEEMIQSKPWRWIITLHPMIDDVDIINHYTTLAVRYPNVMFRKQLTTNDLRQGDVMLSDMSSIILEFQLLGKPVVTFRNTSPGPHIIDVSETKDVAEALEQALTRPQPLMDAIAAHTSLYEAHRDAKNSARVLDAIDDFIDNWQGKLKRKPRQWLRRWQLYKQSQAYRQ